MWCPGEGGGRGRCVTYKAVTAERGSTRSKVARDRTLTLLTAAGTLSADHPFSAALSPFLCACHPFGGSAVGGQFRGRGGTQTTYYS